MRAAAYVRYSTDKQREASLEDQLRNIRARCAREGWPQPAVYSDAAISGTRTDRPGLKSLLADAERNAFDLVLLDDLSRISRDNTETGSMLKRFAFAGIRVIGVSDGTDTGRDGHELDTGIKAVINAHQVREIARRTHRGLTGRALAGASAGGLPYGYTITATGQRAVDPAKADVVRRIYAEFAAGDSPRTIAAGLNRDRIPSPRGSTWAVSAIYGDVARGIGILANPIYAGRQVWNRSTWVKRPDGKGRARRDRPESEWIVTEHPELAIVDANLFAAAQARIRATRTKTSANRARGHHGGPGRPNKHPLSGILRCSDCGAPLVVVNQCSYACSTRIYRGDTACANRITVNRHAAEHALLDGVRALLGTEAAYRMIERDVAAQLKVASPDLDALQSRVRQAEREHANIMTAIKAGIITHSTKTELLAAEEAIRIARADLDAAKQYAPANMVPRLREIWRNALENLRANAEPAALRGALIELIGDRVPVRRDAETGETYAEIGSSDQGEIKLVAGAGFEPTTFGL